MTAPPARCEVWEPEPCKQVAFSNPPAPYPTDAPWCNTHDRPWDDCVAALRQRITDLESLYRSEMAHISATHRCCCEDIGLQRLEALLARARTEGA
jgi:hypothetical protein